MNTITLDLNIPADFNVDLDALKSAATDYVQKYIYMLQSAKNAKTQNKVVSAIRELRGSLDSAIKATKQEKLFETNDIDELMDSLMK